VSRFHEITGEGAAVQRLNKADHDPRQGPRPVGFFDVLREAYRETGMIGKTLLWVAPVGVAAFASGAAPVYPLFAGAPVAGGKGDGGASPCQA